jgi:hypothetical protein
MLNTILWILGIVCAVWVIYDVLARNNSVGIVGKVVWVVLALMFSIVTAVVYYFMYKR